MSRRFLAAIALACLCAAGQELNSPDPKTRIKAARALSRSGSESIPQLAPLLKDTSADVRREAVRSIVAIGTQHSLDPLIAATRDNDPEVQLRATEGLVNFYLPGYVETGSLTRLTSAVRSRLDRENTQIIDAYVSVRPEVIRALAGLVRGGGSVDVRAAAARSLGILRGQSAVPELTAALRSKEDLLIYESLIALQKIRDPAAGPGVVFLLRDLQERIQIAAIDTVGVLRTQDAIPDLRMVYGDAKSDRVRAAALGALAMIADPSLKVLFQNGISDPNDRIRTAAAEGFARVKDKSARSLLQTAFDSEKKMGPRLADAFALVSLGQTETGPLAPLTYLVNTLNSRAYRDVAQPYLTELAREGSVRPVLYGFLRQGTRDEKIGLARALSVSGDRSSIQAIEALTRDPDNEVAQEAIRALKTLQARVG